MTRAEGRVKKLNLIEQACRHTEEGCLIWPYACNSRGHAVIRVNGKAKKVHRIVCEQINGPSPSPEYQTMHSCGNGHLGCIAQNHLSWGTAKQNAKDSRRWITKPLLAKQQILEIHKLRGVLPQKEIAKKFNITKSIVWRIQHNLYWRYV